MLAQLCADEGLFTAAGDVVARALPGRTGPLLGGVFVVAALITAVLSLDATVVLLTPVVIATAARVGARPRPHVYACAHLANSASLLLPVSNLTNLLAFTASGLSFTRFAALMSPAVAGCRRRRVPDLPPLLRRRPGSGRAPRRIRTRSRPASPSSRSSSSP